MPSVTGAQGRAARTSMILCKSHQHGSLLRLMGAGLELCRVCLQSLMADLCRRAEASILPGLGRPPLLVRGVPSGQRWEWSCSVEVGRSSVA